MEFNEQVHKIDQHSTDTTCMWGRKLEGDGRVGGRDDEGGMIKRKKERKKKRMLLTRVGVRQQGSNREQYF